MEILREFVLWISFFGTFGLSVNYSGFQVWRVAVQSPATGMTLVEDIKGIFSGELDIWAEGRNYLDVLVGPQDEGALRDLLDKRQSRHEVLIEDVQNVIDDQSIARPTRMKGQMKFGDGRITLEEYHTYLEIEAYLQELSSVNPLVTLEVGGQTQEGRNLWIAQITRAQPGSPAVWIDCGIHAREWVSPATCLWIIDSLTANQNDQVNALLDSYVFYILPVMNADGYDYSWTDDRLWRKNRRINEGQTCIGVDLNRNYNATNWGGLGSSDSSCGDTYHGPTPLSEAETQALTSKLLGLQSEGSPIHASFSIHSYSQLWLFAYGWTGAQPEYYDDMMRVAEVGVAAIAAVNGSVYTPGQHFTAIYPATGTIVDWGYELLGLPYTYIIEGRDTGEYGFLLPESLIAVTATEIWEGIQAAILAI